MKKILASLIALLLAMSVSAQILDPVKWRATSAQDAKTGLVTVKLTATMESGWHVYGMDIDPNLGPAPLAVDWTELRGLKPVGKLTPDRKPIKNYDEMFEADLTWWEGRLTLSQQFEPTAESYLAKGTVHFGTCSNSQCLRPQTFPFSVSGKATLPADAPAAEPAEVATPADTAAVSPAAVADSIAPAAPSAASAKYDVNSPLWAPVQFTEQDAADSGNSTSLWWIFFTCFLGGFLALLTPCVWPMIPLTVSFFLKKDKSRVRAIRDAMTYSLSIIVIYVLLGIVVTVIFGPSSLNALSTSAVCNIIFFLLLVVFAISFFGAFDITLPSGLVNKMDARAETTTGLLGIFFMAFTLTLVSFSCTGPIIGTLLVEAASTGDKFGPAIGMFGFALALAIPFGLFALFPSWLQSAPKSGSWMNTVKVVLGFIELALSLKFLSVADLAYGWHILDREAFLALWIVMFGLLGAYLLGVFNFSHFGEPDKSVGIVRFFLALASLSFAVYLVPGLWGAPLKGVSAFVPPLYTQDFNLYGTGFHEYNDYEEGMAAAATEGKPVLIDFSGYGCVNCRKMEGAVLDQPDVKAMIEDNFVVVKLMVDEKKALPQPVTVKENGSDVRLDSYGDLWSYLQRHKFGANAQPYYVIVNAQGQLLSGPFSYDENVPRFTRFLQNALH